jgi:hypothetical protein
MRGFVRDLKEWGLGTAWHNLRWRAGYAIGGFTSARRSSR